MGDELRVNEETESISCQTKQKYMDSKERISTAWSTVLSIAYVHFDRNKYVGNHKT